MGITTTWGLRFPDGNQFPDAAQLKDLAQDIDGALTTLKNQLAAPMLAYTPAINFNCGTNVGYYKRVGGSNLIHAQFEQVIETGQAPAFNGTALTFGLPVPAAAWDDVVGFGFLFRGSVALPLEFIGIGVGSVGAYRYLSQASGSPVVLDRIKGNTWSSWAAGDRFFGEVQYRTGS